MNHKVCFAIKRKLHVCTVQIVPSVKFRYSEKATKKWKKNFLFVLTSVGNFEERWEIFFQVLWISHNIWTLLHCKYLRQTTPPQTEGYYVVLTDVCMPSKFRHICKKIIHTFVSVLSTYLGAVHKLCSLKEGGGVKNCLFWDDIVYGCAIEDAILTDNMPLIHASFMCSKWNMDKKFCLKFHLPWL